LDGPEISLTADDAPVYLIIGGSYEDEDDHGDAGQVIATLGSRQRDEEGTVVCQAVAQSGGIDLPDGPETLRALRQSAFKVLGDVAVLLRENPTLGITAPRMVAEMGAIVPHQFLTETGGSVVVIDFRVTYIGRI